MKKLMTIAAIATMVILSSCTKDALEPVNNNYSNNTTVASAPQQQAIGFENFIHKATKAVTATEYSNLSGVKISCYISNASTGKYKSAYYSNKYFKNFGATPNTWNTADAADATSAHVYYWPATTISSSAATENLNFYAANESFTDANLNDGDALVGPSIAYSGAQKDIVIASQTGRTAQAGAMVGLAFDHILSQVTLKAMGKDSGFDYEVTAVSMGKDGENTQIKKDGTFTFDGAHVQGTLGGSWSNLSNTKAFEFTGLSEDCPYSVNPTYVQIGENFVAVPQNTSGVKLAVTYNVTDENGTVVFNGTKSITLTIDWAASKNYVYNIQLPSDAKPITYTVAVNGWQNGTLPDANNPVVLQ